METFVYFIIALIGGFYVYKAYKKTIIAKREKLINTFQFPPAIAKKVIEKYPHLNDQQAAQVINGLCEYFHLCNIAGREMVSMPSQVVDVAWHEFILFTRRYEQFCNKALGRFLHHTPAEAMSSPTLAQAGIKTAWRIACYRENIEPKSPLRLPTLFALDTELNIPNGFRYSLNCTGNRKTDNSNYCAGHIGCGSGCAGDSGSDSSFDSGSDSSGCGGGCGGD